MKSFFIRRERDLVSAVKKDAWTVWFGHGLTETEHSGWCVSMRPACTQQWAQRKKSWWERRTERKRAVLENVPPWRCRQGSGPSWGEGNRNLRMPDFHPEGRERRLWLACPGLISHTRVPMPLTTTCSADLWLTTYAF